MSFYFRLILGLVWLVSWVFGLPEAGGPDPPASQSIHCGLKWFEDHPVKGSASMYIHIKLSTLFQIHFTPPFLSHQS